MANSRDNASDRQGSSNQASQGNTSRGGNGGGQSQRGFASMDSDRQREISAQGGRAAHASGNAHQFTSEEARAAGAKSHSGNGGSGNSRSGSNS
jgi:uncharacterized protein